MRRLTDRLKASHERVVAPAESSCDPKRLSLVDGHEQQLGVAGFVPEDALAVDPGGVVAQDPKRRFDLGAAVAAVNAQRQPRGPGERLRAARAAAVARRGSGSSRWSTGREWVSWVGLLKECSKQAARGGLVLHE